MIQIPLPKNNPYFEITVVLDNRAWVLEFMFNFFMNTHTFSVLSSDSERVVSGIPLQENLPLLTQYQNSSYDLPRGNLVYLPEYTGHSPDNSGLSGTLYYQEAVR